MELGKEVLWEGEKAGRVGCGMGRLLYGKDRSLQGGCWHLRKSPSYSRLVLLSQEDKARTVFLLQLEQANP